MKRRSVRLPLGSSDIDRGPEPIPALTVVFRGSKQLCREFSLVLEAQAIEHEVQESGDFWLLAVAPALADRAHDEFSRYSAERRVPRSRPILIEPAFRGGYRRRRLRADSSGNGVLHRHRLVRRRLVVDWRRQGRIRG